VDSAAAVVVLLIQDLVLVAQILVVVVAETKHLGPEETEDLELLQ
jgi:hypothetical protein